ncbi:MAG TPA: hypothetical protein VH370_16185 [Humisphaera sp.]|jgi:hypothetical protein|nr:hypothetical protein [Humisphaera sp.]
MRTDPVNPEPVLPPPLPGLPDWNAIGAEILCPLCGYNLRGLVEPRCPECGYQFVWTELLAAQTLDHPYLFEHGRRRRWQTFWKTLREGLFPGTFWQELKPAQPVRVRWLWIYFAIVMFVPLGAASLTVWRTDPHAYFHYTYAFGLDLRPAGVYLAAAILFWPLATVVALSIFRMSMQMAKLRSVHSLRCVIYSADIVFWMGIALLLAEGLLEAASHSSYAILVPSDFYLLLLMALCIPIFIWRLGRAYQLYLKLDKPFLTVLATQVIVFLALTAIVANVVYKPWR